LIKFIISVDNIRSRRYGKQNFELWSWSKKKEAALGYSATKPDANDGSKLAGIHTT